MVLTLDRLPDEILLSILCYSPPSSSAALTQTARRFRNVTNEPTLWRFYSQAYFNFWDAKHEMSKKLASPVLLVNWRTLYIRRHLIDGMVSKLVDSILQTQTGRIEKFRAIIDLGYDAKDTLLRHISVNPEKKDFLARRYYAKALLSCLHRGIAVSEWAQLSEAVSLERALGAFDLFVPESGYGDLHEITAALDKVVSRLVAIKPEITCFTPRHKALAIASYLRTNHLTGISENRGYHCLEHNFLGIALNDSEHNSLPLISAAIYCYIAQRLGLRARPCGFPFHVHVIVTPSPWFDLDGNELNAGDQGSPMYIDPFHSDLETPISDLRNQLNLLGASAIDQTPFLEESSNSEIALRCGKNILNSVQHVTHFDGPHITPLDITSAKYAGLWSSILLCGPSRAGERRFYLSWLMELFATEFLWDAHLIEEYLAPLFQNMPEYDQILECLHVIRAADEMPKQVRRRTAAHEGVRYRIGQVFQHRRYNYVATITGWDAECDAGEEWMIRMGVDRLPAGRHQSFYHVLAEDKSVRYVAEENIKLIKPRTGELPEMLMAIAGKHFKRWDEESRTFVSNIKDEYPDD